MLRVEGVVQVGEHVHLSGRRFGTCSLPQFVRFREVEAHVKVVRAHRCIFPASRRPIVNHTIMIIVFACGDGVKASAMRIQYGRQVNIQRKLGIDARCEIVPGIGRVSLFSVKVVTVHRQVQGNASPIFLIALAIGVSVAARDNKHAEALPEPSREPRRSR